MREARAFRFFKPLCCITIISLVGFFSFFVPTNINDALYLPTANREQCNIPSFYPFDASIMKYIFTPDPIVCTSDKELTYMDANGLLHLNTSVSDFHDVGNVSCVYNIIERNDDDVTITYRDSVEISFPVDIPADHFRVTCIKNQEEIVYTRLYFHIHVASNESSQRTSLNEYYSVIVFGLDSVSRLNGIRQLPKTYRYLTENLDAYDFSGYTKVGANTFPNLIPMLCGKRVEGQHPEISTVTKIDDYPLIWNNFSSNGYIRLFAEDKPAISIFNFKKTGFIQPPTEHYMRPWWLAKESSSRVNNFMNTVWLGFENRRIHFGKSSQLCYRDVPNHMLVINYLKEFYRKYRNQPTFAFSWLTELGHDYLNMINIGDNDFVDFLKYLHDLHVLDNSFLLLLSDHGHATDGIRNTVIGTTEARMPFFTFMIPQKLKAKYPHLDHNLRQNTKRLTSPYDIYETLKDILHMRFEYDRNSDDRLDISRGYSLFQQIPKTRTCEEADYPENYCPCYYSKSVNTSHPTVRLIGEYIIQKINIETQVDRSICATLHLLTIYSAYKTEFGEQTATNVVRRLNFWRDSNMERHYLVVVEATPGNGLFEATVDYKSANTLNLLGTINRINKYGNQSDCTKMRVLKAYCFCQ